MTSQVLSIRDDYLQQTRQPEMLRLQIPFVILASLAVPLRFLSRRFRKAPLGADDWMIVVSLV